MHFFAFRNPYTLNSLAFASSCCLDFSNLRSRKMLCFLPAFFKWRSNALCITARLSGSYSPPSFFRISAKKRQRIASSSSGGISSKRLASLRWSFHSLKTFSHVFVLLAVFEFSVLLLRVLISSSCNHGNLSFVLELLKMEKFGKFSSLNSSMLSTTMATCAAFSADVCSLLIGWFHNPLFFLGFHWPKQTVLFFPK